MVITTDYVCTKNMLNHIIDYVYSFKIAFENVSY